MVSTPAQFRRFRIKNQTRHCLAEGCDKFRARTARFCTNHNRANLLYGHPLAKHIPSRRWTTIASNSTSSLVATSTPSRSSSPSTCAPI